jgi:hypothetical protein
MVYIFSNYPKTCREDLTLTSKLKGDILVGYCSKLSCIFHENFLIFVRYVFPSSCRLYICSIYKDTDQRRRAFKSPVLICLLLLPSGVLGFGVCVSANWLQWSPLINEVSFSQKENYQNCLILNPRAISKQLKVQNWMVLIVEVPKLDKIKGWGAKMDLNKHF